MPELRAFDQIPAELIKAGCRTICSEIHNHINSILNKEELPEEWKASITVPIYKKGDRTDCRNRQAYHFRQLCTKFFQHPVVKVTSIIIISNLSNDRSKASSKTIPPYSAI